MADENTQRKSPPRDNLVRGVFPADLELRDDSEDAAPTLHGHFSVFDTWTEINSMWEGQFMERIAPGAFKKTIRENRAGMRVLLNHGQDPQLGNKPIAAINDIREDDVGAYYEAELFRSVPDLVMDGLRAGQYGASFRFRVMREEWDDDPKPSDANPRGLPKRTIKEAQVMEFGPVTWGAYPEATAGVRSLTDEWRAAQSTSVNATKALVDAGFEPDEVVSAVATGDFTRLTHTGKSTVTLGESDTVTTTTTNDAAPSHPTESPAEQTLTEDNESRRDTQPEPEQRKENKMNPTSLEEMRSRLADIVTEIREIANENYGQVLDADQQDRWNALDEERVDLEKRIAATEERQAYLEDIAVPDTTTTDQPTRKRESVNITRHGRRNELPQNLHAIEEYTARAQSREHFKQLTADGARAALEQFNYPSVDKAEANERIERLIDGDSSGEMVQRVLLHGAPAYRSAYWKTMLKQPLSRQEQDALHAGMALEDRSITTSNTGGVTVPINIDPTIIPVSNGVLNPVRAISKVITTTSHQWQGVTSTGVSFTRRAEGSAMADGAPTLVAPSITPSRVDVFVPFSWEAAADWAALEAELAPLFADAKDAEEASSFVNGNGTAPNPRGFMTDAGTVLGTSATVFVGTVDLLALQDALPARFQANATWLMAPAMTSKVRALTSTAQGSWWAESLQRGVPSQLLGYPIYKQTNVGTAGSGSPPVASVKWGIIGDFNYFQIVDRVGFQTHFIPDLFSGNTAGSFGYPVGMSGIAGYYRNGCSVLTSNAFRVGTVT